MSGAPGKDGMSEEEKYMAQPHQVSGALEETWIVVHVNVCVAWINVIINKRTELWTEMSGSLLAVTWTRKTQAYGHSLRNLPKGNVPYKLNNADLSTTTFWV